MRRWPFLSLAIVTIAIGAAWHAARIEPSAGPLAFAAYIAVYVIGAPFIAAMTFATATIGRSALTPVVGLLLGLAPYLLAEWILRRRRSRVTSH